MKTKKFQKSLSLNKQTIADLDASRQGVIMAGIIKTVAQWTCNVPTQCVPAHVTECGINCEPTDYSCFTDCYGYTCGGDTCQVTCPVVGPG